MQYGDRLNTEERRELELLVDEFRDCFSQGAGHVGRTHLVEHEIRTGGAAPIRHRPYRVSPSERRLIASQVNNMLAQEIIRESTSPWAFPVVLVKKKNNDWRFCVDYRSLNDGTVKDAYPLPRLDAVTERLAGARYFSKLDLAGGFWQI